MLAFATCTLELELVLAETTVDRGEDELPLLPMPSGLRGAGLEGAGSVLVLPAAPAAAVVLGLGDASALTEALRTV